MLRNLISKSSFLATKTPVFQSGLNYFSKVSQKVMFRIYFNEKESELYYFNLSTPISEIQKMLNHEAD